MIIARAAVAVAFLAAASAKCTQASDCMYNGDCKAGICECGRGWIGDTCSILDLQPARLGGAYGYTPNVSSWGGEVLHVEGKYHLYASEMVGGCGLTEWYENSRIVHATSDNLFGPYAFKDEAIESICFLFLHREQQPQAILHHQTLLRQRLC